MIDDATATRILQETETLWRQKVQTVPFLELTRGSERGHRIADYVSDITTSLLKANFDTRFQASPRGGARSRSMGDIWLRCAEMYNPINVKTGEYEKNGQPNIVSLKKLLRALLADQIDSYYLLIVKFRLGSSPSCHCRFVDLLDCLEFATFDSGPGQMMLKEREFYAPEASMPSPGQAKLIEKIGKLFAMLEDGERRLTFNRRQALEKLRRSYREYMARPVHVLDQSSLQLVHE